MIQPGKAVSIAAVVALDPTSEPLCLDTEEMVSINQLARHIIEVFGTPEITVSA